MDNDYSNTLMPRKSRPTQRGYGGPAALVFIAAIVVLMILGATAVFAQSSESTAVSGAAANVEVATGAAAGVVINNSGQKAGKDGRVYGEVATAPSLGGLALGGGHPCAYSPATAQVSIIGGGAGIGGMKVDSACMLMVMGATGDKAAYKAAQLVIAGRDKSACRAMEAVGLVSGCAEPKGGGRNWARPADTAVNAGTGAKCIKEGRRITFRATSDAAKASELEACKASFGL